MAVGMAVINRMKSFFAKRLPFAVGSREQLEKYPEEWKKMIDAMKRFSQTELVEFLNNEFMEELRKACIAFNVNPDHIELNLH